MTDPIADRAGLSLPSHPAAGRAGSNSATRKNLHDPERLNAVCREMESLFLNQLLKEMRTTIPDAGLLSGGPGKEIYTSLMDSHLAADISRKGGIGLASVLKSQLAGGILSPNTENNAQESRGLADDPIE